MTDRTCFGLGPSRRLAAVVFAFGFALLSVSRSAVAGDFQLAVGASGAATEWRGDVAVYSSLKLGYRFADLVGVYGMGRLGYGAVDDRMLTLLSFGAQVWGQIDAARPYARIGFAHQHEESLVVVRDDVGGALFGVGDGIRHRAGGEGAIGVEIPFADIGRGASGAVPSGRGRVQMFGALEGSALWLPNAQGPNVYGGGGVSLGMSYWL